MLIKMGKSRKLRPALEALKDAADRGPERCRRQEALKDAADIHEASPGLVPAQEKNKVSGLIMRMQTKKRAEGCSR